MKELSQFNRLRKPLTAALCAAVGAVGVAACGGTTSISLVAEGNGFKKPTNIEEVDGDHNRVIFDAMYGKCTITLRSSEPWYDNDALTYIPHNDKLPEVANATAEKLSALPDGYGLDVCEVQPPIRR